MVSQSESQNEVAAKVKKWSAKVKARHLHGCLAHVATDSYFQGYTSCCILTTVESFAGILEDQDMEGQSSSTEEESADVGTQSEETS